MAFGRLSYISLLIISACFTQIYIGSLSSIIFISVLILPLVAFILAFIGASSIKIGFDTSYVTIEKGDSLKFSVSVKNGSIIPCSCAYISALIPNSEKNDSSRLVFSIGALRSKTLSLVCNPQFRGNYEIVLECFYVYDMLRIFKLKKKCGLRKSFSVFPRIYDLNMGEGFFSEPKEEASPKISDISEGEHSFVRKYKDGDEIKRIHWKLSSKQEEYIVWQDSKNSSLSFHIICDLTQPMNCDEKHGLTLTDSILETAIALSLFHIKCERQCVISYYDSLKKLSQSLFLSNMNDIREACTEMVSLKSYSEGYAFEEETKKHFIESEKTKRIILITHRGDSLTAKLAEELSLISAFDLIIIGSIEDETNKYLKKLKNVSYTALNPYDLKNEILKIFSQFYKA